MNQKEVLGRKIKQRREKLGLSRGEFCGGEEELTVRQLARIEAGESLPTLPKLEFIAERLSVSVSLLVDRKYVELPKRYLQLKQRICKFYTHREKERIAEKEQLFDKIYNEYYEDLPEEEQVAIDAQYAGMNIHINNDANFGEGLLGDYFFQVLQKNEYSTNDLLLIELYFGYIHLKEYDEALFFRLFNRVIDQIDYSIGLEQFILIRLMIGAISAFLEFNNYDKIIEAVIATNTIMQKNQDFQKKPIIDMHEGKYYLFAQKDSHTAKRKYEEGAKFAEMMGDSDLSEKILQEWALDLAEFERR